MQIVIEIDEARYKDIQRIAEVQLESNHFQTAEQIIANGVPIEREPKTGHWKRISMDNSEHAKYWYRCDRCGKNNLGNTDWCPNCGCRMVEPQESEG